METYSKIHIGLLDPEHNLETLVKEALISSGTGGYVHTTRTMLELSAKISTQKMQLIISNVDPDDTANTAQAMVSFLRSKRDSKDLPILLLTPDSEVKMKHLITDARTRAFSSNTGAFVPLMTMMPLISATTETLNAAKALSLDWIEDQFISALKEKLGGALDFQCHSASYDDTHAAYLGQYADEIRSHLGWFKLSARILKENNEGMAKLAKSMDSDTIEEMANMQITTVVKDFTQRVYMELIGKGAIFFPPIEDMHPADRKTLYSNAQAQAVLFRSPEMTVVLELNRYL